MPQGCAKWLKWTHNCDCRQTCKGMKITKCAKYTSRHVCITTGQKLLFSASRDTRWWLKLINHQDSICYTLESLFLTSQKEHITVMGGTRQKKWPIPQDMALIISWRPETKMMNWSISGEWLNINWLFYHFPWRSWHFGCPKTWNYA